jgi:pimeloyl-ACP methyl ester carboxylesterase
MSVATVTNGLPPALGGVRRELESGRVGQLSWYQAAPSTLARHSRPLLLVHSVNAAAAAYEVKPLYERYADRRPVYALDLPGFGHSERSDRAYDPRLMTDAIHALLALIGREHAGQPVDALALSLSCEFLARAAVEAPDRFRSVALVSPTGFNRKALREGAEGGTLGLAGPLAFLTRFGLRRPLFDLLTRRSVIAHFLRGAWGGGPVDEGLLDYCYATARRAGAEFAPLRFVSGYLFSADSGSLYRALSVPVWVAHGVRGDFADYPALRLLAGRPNWTIDVLPSGALPHFELAEEFVRRYDAWCAGLDALQNDRAAP